MQSRVSAAGCSSVVSGGQRCRIEAENVAGLLRGFLPARRRRTGEVPFRLVLAKAQGAFVGSHLGEQPAQIGCLLSLHSAAPIIPRRLSRSIVLSVMVCASLLVAASFLVG
jgi:hypothetical protein